MRRSVHPMISCCFWYIQSYWFSYSFVFNYCTNPRYVVDHAIICVVFLFSTAILNCYSQLLFSTAILNCSSQLLFSTALLNCSSQLLSNNINPSNFTRTKTVSNIVMRKELVIFLLHSRPFKIGA